MTGETGPTVAELRVVVERLIRAGNRLAAALARAGGDASPAPPRVRCSRCGYTCPLRELRDHTVCVVLPRVTGRPEDWRPGVWEVVCPECGAAEPFDAAIVCTECGQRDCRCRGEDIEEHGADGIRRSRPGSRAEGSRKDGT